MASVVFVIIAMIWAYLADRLPHDCYNDFDNLLLGRTRRVEDGYQVDVFRSWILAMSDQQLVSGLAMVVAINMIRNGVAGLDSEITGFAYNNAVVLAFFSCMIHLATLSTLRTYLTERGGLKHIRAALMICMLVLLLQGLAETWRELDAYKTLRCAVVEYHYDGYLDSDHESVNIGTVLGLTTLLFLLASGYLRRISALYSWGGGAVLRSRLVSIWAGGRTINYTEPQIDEAERNLALRWARSKSFWTLFFFTVLPKFNESFVFEIIWALSYFTIGIAQMSYFLAIDYDSSVSSRISFEPDFGQLLPLILLGLPILAMFEGHSGESPPPLLP